MEQAPAIPVQRAQRSEEETNEIRAKMQLDSLFSDWTFQIAALEDTRLKLRELGHQPPRALGGKFVDLAEEIAGMTFEQKQSTSSRSPLTTRVKGKGNKKGKKGVITQRAAPRTATPPAKRPTWQWTRSR